MKSINIKLSPDVAESTDDVLKQDYSKTDLSYPLLPDSIQNMEVTEITKEDNKSGEGQHLLIKMRTLQDNQASGKDMTIYKGFGASTRIGLSLTEKYTKDMRERSLAELSMAGAQGGKSLADLDSWKGTVVQVKVSKAKENPPYGPSNNFRFVPLKAKS